MTWLTRPRCPTCLGVLELAPASGLALCDCGQPILVEREVLVRWRVTVAPVLAADQARETYVSAVVGALGPELARAVGWAR
jgi:hypothetical protein